MTNWPIKSECHRSYIIRGRGNRWHKYLMKHNAKFREFVIAFRKKRIGE